MPVDALCDDEDWDDDIPPDSDYYSMRFCEVRGCGIALPLDKPGRYVSVSGEKLLVCEGCYENFHEDN